jgi:DNA-directed RNA polymerase specialized sigma24 family protein
VFGWLRTVAIHEAYRLSRTERRDAHLEDLADGAACHMLMGCVGIDDAVEARRALRVLASLPDREREDLVLLVAGFSYREIADITGGRTFTNVNKHLSRARARARHSNAA